MSAPSDEPFLIWEDEEPDSQQWWLARAHESEGEARELFVALDEVAGYLIGVVRRPPSTRYKVIAAIPLAENTDTFDSISNAKGAVAGWLASGSRVNVWHWRSARWSKFTLAHLPILVAGFIVGGVLGLLVAIFGVSSGLLGWPMLAAGLVIGVGAGPVLKFLVDRHPENAISGPWVRFMVISLAAISGAALVAGSVFALIWNA